MLNAPDEELTEEERQIKKEQKLFLNKMFAQQFPDIIEIILIYSQKRMMEKNHCTELVQEINKKVLQLVLEIMKEKSDFENILKKLKNEFKIDKNPVVS